MPEGVVYVGRPSRWGNPWVIEDLGKDVRVVHQSTRETFSSGLPAMRRARQDATTAFRRSLERGELPYSTDDVQRELAGYDLCCWCRPTPLNPNGSLNWLGLQCHAEVLLEYANLGEWEPVE